MKTAKGRPPRLPTQAALVLPAGLAWLFLSFASLHAAYSLDGSNCIIFVGAPKRDLAQCVRRTSEGHTLSVVLTSRAPNAVSKTSISRDGKPAFQTLTLFARPTLSSSDVEFP